MRLAELSFVGACEETKERGTDLVSVRVAPYHDKMRLRSGAGAPRVVTAAELPSTLGSYALLTKLASGGMGTVYVGNKQGVAGFERLVAIKCCHPHLRDDREFVDMFLDEARLAARIHHPNVVATLDVACTDVLYLVMEYIEGDSLFGILRRAQRAGAFLPIGVATRIVLDVLRGLHAAHQLHGSDGAPLNLVHRDVSPQNILVGVDGVSRISDFGVAFAAARTTATDGGRLKGKFSYMAPEQLRNEDANRRLDVFSAGVVLWEALACRPLFRRKDDIATINAVLATEVPAPSSIVAAIPPALDAVVLKALQRDPAARYQSAAELADALEQLPIEPASPRAVAAFVEGSLGTSLAERRAQIREASESAQPGFDGAPIKSDVRPSPVRSAIDVPLADVEVTTIAKTDWMNAPTQSAPTPLQSAQPPAAPPVATRDAIEHRRIRGLLAAAMLLLVGSALGLLLARSSDEPDAAPAKTSAQQEGR